DLPLHGRRFTWCRVGGSSMSSIDRFLISEFWSTEWPSSKQWCLDKEISDHCPIMLCESTQNWGPKSFRMLTCWKEIEGYHNFVKEHWKELQVEGWGIIHWQKSRVKGDANTKYFLGCINKRRRNNEILTLEMNDRKLYEVNEIKDAIVDHFQRHFASRGNRPVPANVEFKTISNADQENLTREFSEEEVRKAVWECESSKSPGPDGVSFEFVKEFWDEVKDDFYRVVAEFHSNGDFQDPI
ncbi:cysteine-rich receptor-like protein kinase, partial [Trifolium pratense]